MRRESLDQREGGLSGIELESDVYAKEGDKEE